MGTHLYDSFHSFERTLEGNQELSNEVLKNFGGRVEFNGCKLLWRFTHLIVRHFFTSYILSVNEKLPSKPGSINTWQYLFHSEKTTADTSAFIFKA